MQHHSIQQHPNQGFSDFGIGTEQRNVLACRYKPSDEPRKQSRRGKEMKIPNRVGAMTQPCFTPLFKTGF